MTACDPCECACCASLTTTASCLFDRNSHRSSTGGVYRCLSAREGGSVGCQEGCKRRHFRQRNHRVIEGVDVCERNTCHCQPSRRVSVPTCTSHPCQLPVGLPPECSFRSGFFFSVFLATVASAELSVGYVVAYRGSLVTIECRTRDSKTGGSNPGPVSQEHKTNLPESFFPPSQT